MIIAESFADRKNIPWAGASSRREPSEDVSVLARLRENKPLMWPVLGIAAYGVLTNLAVDIGLRVRRLFQIRESTAMGK